MLRFNPSWFHRIYRNEQPEVHVTVIENPTNPVEQTPQSAVTDAVQGAAQIAALASTIAQTDPEVLTRMDAIIGRLDGINSDLSEIRGRLSTIETNTAALVVTEVIEENVESTPDVILPEVPLEVIPQTQPVAPTEEPKKRKRSFV